MIQGHEGLGESATLQSTSASTSASTYDYDEGASSSGNDWLAQTGTGVYDAADVLIDINTTTYGYDANGNQTSVTSHVGDPTEETATYSYNFENRLSNSSLDTSGHGYSYDGEGQRLSAASSTPTEVTYRY